MFPAAFKTTANAIFTLVRPALSASTLFSCTLFAGDIIGQYISSRSSSLYLLYVFIMSRDLRRSLCVGVSGFCVSGPLSYSIGQLLLRLYPGCGPYTVLKRVVLSTCASPLVVTCGIVPSVYLQTRDVDTVMVD